ncbi:uncharacterized protein JN550_005411 [Neoarthrinium moseri]|uniref:uncharacterized protein n=1 Tax=Neoarthrinium moseri TaxID=1658444 RepID=UPI001FDD96E7|nr:uncharacterized protein JN550_005411 [Neoarthrinium moseri]KAI1869821.1 hypothetical protein JN550_005411 [Neoarthrinium moseri]
MSNTTAKPTFLLVQGSFQSPDVYHKLTRALAEKGYPAVQPRLPSLTNPEEFDKGSKSLTDDALAIKAELEKLVEQQKLDVVVLMHSYGGLVGSEAVTQDLTRDWRVQQAKMGGVTHLFFFTAFILEEGQSVLDVFGESPNNDIKSNGRFRVKDAGRLLYGDLPVEEAQYWESRIVDQSYAVQETKLSRAAYRYVPSTYLICEEDQAVPAAYQKIFAQLANATTLKMKTRHSPMLSKPSELADVIIGALQGNS